MMSRIARKIENQRRDICFSGGYQRYLIRGVDHRKLTTEDAISLNVMDTIRVLKVKFILTPTHTGSTPRRISRFKPDCWIISFCQDRQSRDFLCLSYGVYPFLNTGMAPGYEAIAIFLKDEGLAKKGDRVILAEMVVPGQLGGIDSMGIVTLT